MFWKRTGWPTVAAMGLLLAVQASALALQQGMLEGIDQGFQRLETGQVEIQGTDGGISHYFALRALVEQIPGVVATSARLTFSAELRGPGGLTRSVRVRACNFAQEQKVTGLGDRMILRKDFLTNGFVLSLDLENDPDWKDRSTVTLASPDGRFSPAPVEIVGTVYRSVGPSADDLCYLNLDAAFALLGPSTEVSSVVVRLESGVDASRWIAEHRDAFQGLDVSLASWKEILTNDFPGRRDFLGPLEELLLGIALLASAGVILVAAHSRSPRSGLSMVLRTGRKNGTLAVGLLGLTAVLGCLLLVITAPWYQDLILGRLRETYPFVGAPRLLWSWTWREGLVGCLTVALGLGAFNRPRRARKPVPG